MREGAGSDLVVAVDEESDPLSPGHGRRRASDDAPPGGVGFRAVHAVNSKGRE